MQRYLSKISGPLLDRIDLHVEVTPVSFNELSQLSSGEKSNEVRTRVVNARNIQSKRFKGKQSIHSNAQMTASLFRKHCVINDAASSLIKTAMEKLGLSARAYDRILKVSRTIADLDNSENIETHHVAEAIQFRSLDREGWGS